MTPSIMAVLALLAAGAAHSAPAGNAALLAQARTFYAAHEVGQKTLDQALKLPVPAPGDAQAAMEATDLRTLLLAARDVQEGCVQPCASQAEIAVYKEKARLVATKLGFSDLLLPQIDERYIPKGKPRLKPAGSTSNAAGQQYEAAAVTLLLSNNSLPPQTREALNRKAMALADALGRTNYIQADGSGVAALPGGRSVRLTPQQIADLNRVPRAQADLLRHLASAPPPSPDLIESSGRPMMPSHQSVDPGLRMAAAHKREGGPRGSANAAMAHAATQSCMRVVNANGQHPALGEMCVNHPTWAPILAGLLDAAKEQFGTLSGILMNLLFLILGLVMSAATGGVALLLKLVALIGAAWVIWKLIASLVSAGKQYYQAKDGSPERAAALKQIGTAGGTLLIMVVMGLVGFGIGKTKPGAAAVKSMETGMASALNKIGATSLMGKINSMIPRSVVTSLERVLGKAPERGAKSALDDAAPKHSPSERAALVKNAVEAVAEPRLGEMIRASGLTGRVAALIKNEARSQVAGDMREILKAGLGNAPATGKVTGQQFNTMLELLIRYAKEVDAGGKGISVIKGWGLKGVYPKGPTAVKYKGFDFVKDLKAEVSGGQLHELAHLFHMIQMRATILQSGIPRAEAAKFIKLMEGGANYSNLEYFATSIGKPGPGTGTGSHFNGFAQQLISATERSMDLGKVQLPAGVTIEKGYAYWATRVVPAVMGKSYAEAILVRIPLYTFLGYYAVNIDTRRLPVLSELDTKTLEAMGVPPGKTGMRDVVNAMILWGPKKVGGGG